MSLWTREDHAGGTRWRTRMHDGQARAWRSEKRFVCVLAGTQGGKTSWGPLWLHREIQRRGAGDYLAVTANYDLFKLKMLPALREAFEHVFRIGRFWSGDRVIELLNPVTQKFHASRADDPMWGRIILRSADAEAGLESATAQAAWLDEAGLFRAGDSWEAVLRRLSISQGRVLITTTVYDLGWLKQRVYDPWAKRRGEERGHPEIDVVNFDSVVNPSFPQAEYERAKAELPRWKFDMFYRGLFTRPAGLIYDNFKPEHRCPRFTIPPEWPRTLGLDFGGVNTAGIFLARECRQIKEPNKPARWEPTEPARWYAYREYYPREGRTAGEHAKALLAGEPRIPHCIGGARSEGQWRVEFAQAGLPVHLPLVPDVEVGINRAYSMFAKDALIVFDDLTYTIDNLTTYSRLLDEFGNATEDIDDKSAFHLCDALRYAATKLAAPAASNVMFIG